MTGREGGETGNMGGQGREGRKAKGGRKEKNGQRKEGKGGKEEGSIPVKFLLRIYHCDAHPCRQETIKKRIHIRLLINFSKTIATKNIVAKRQRIY